jgi:hypothetical protein
MGQPHRARASSVVRLLRNLFLVGALRHKRACHVGVFGSGLGKCARRLSLQSSGAGLQQKRQELGGPKQGRSTETAQSLTWRYFAEVLKVPEGIFRPETDESDGITFTTRSRSVIQRAVMTWTFPWGSSDELFGDQYRTMRDYCLQRKASVVIQDVSSIVPELVAAAVEAAETEEE